MNENLNCLNFWLAWLSMPCHLTNATKRPVAYLASYLLVHCTTHNNNNNNNNNKIKRSLG